jgi:general secretion pathway protein F
MLLMFIVFVVLGFLSSIGKKIMPTTADKIIMKIPFYKDLILARNNYTILYGLSLLVKSGVSMEHALQLSANSAPKGSLKDDLARAVASVKKGQPWSNGMNTLHPTDKAALAISESKEQIANTLDALAFQYRENYGRVVASFGPTLQVVSALFLVLSGGILFGYTILPILQVAAGGMG